MKTSYLLKRSVIFSALFIAFSLPVHAGLFDDTEARAQIEALTSRVETLYKTQFEQSTQIQELREENARLRGAAETLGFEVESAKKREQDFYIDLDTRIRQLEGSGSASSSSAAKSANDVKSAEKVENSDNSENSESTANTANTENAEARDYEAAINLFKAKKLKEAISAFSKLVKTYPNTETTPNAQYWLGNSYFASGDCKRAIDAHRVVLAKWEKHAKAPDALFNIAQCQAELGDKKGEKTSLDALIFKYPKSDAAAKARRLKK